LDTITVDGGGGEGTARGGKRTLVAAINALRDVLPNALKPVDRIIIHLNKFYKISQVKSLN
jgi:hypothetical protein